MRALDPEVFDAVWAAIEPLLPPHDDRHPLGCHRPRAGDRDCFRVMVVRLSTGCSWEDAERLCGNVVSDTTARARRDEWLSAGLYDAIVAEAIAGYDRVIGLDLSEASVDGSQHKAPTGGEGSGRNGTVSVGKPSQEGSAKRSAKPPGFDRGSSEPCSTYFTLQTTLMPLTTERGLTITMLAALHAGSCPSTLYFGL